MTNPISAASGVLGGGLSVVNSVARTVTNVTSSLLHDSPSSSSTPRPLGVENEVVNELTLESQEESLKEKGLTNQEEEVTSTTPTS